MEIDPFWYSEKYIYTAGVPLDLIFMHRVMNKVGAAYLSSHYRNTTYKTRLTGNLVT